MSGKWICKHCGGEVRLVEFKEYLLDEEGNKIEEDVNEAPNVYHCMCCGRGAHRLSDVADLIVVDSKE